MSLSRELLAATSLIFICSGAYGLSDTPVVAHTGSTSPSFATPPGAHFILSGGLSYGGDTLTTAVYTNGDTQDIKAGSLVQLGMGGYWQMQDSPVAMQLTANYHIDGASGKNGSIKFTRYPIEGLVYYTGFERLHLGGGVRYVLSPSYNYDVGSSYSVSFKDTVGLVGEIGYALTPLLWMNFRVVSEQYKTSSATYSGNHAGLIFTYRFE